MAGGVIQEIDLVIAKQAVDKATQDAALAGKRIGQATAQGSQAELAAGAKWFDQTYGKQGAATGAKTGKELTAALTRQFRLAEADTKEALARGLITPAQAQQRGQEAARAFNVGLLSQIQKLGTSGGLSGAAGQQQFIALAGSLKNVTAEGQKASKGLATVRGGMLQLAASALNTSGPVGTLANGLLAFAGGGVVTLAIAAGLAIIAKGIELITKKSREAAAETKKFFEGLDAAIETRARREDPGKAFFGDFKRIQQEFDDIQRKLAEARRGTTVTTEAGGALTFVDEKEVARLEAQLAKLRDRAIEVGKQLNDALAKPGSVEGARVRVQAVQKVLDTEHELAKLARENDEENRRQLLGFAKDQEQAAEQEANRQNQLADQRTTLMAQLRRQLAGTTATAVDDLELELHDLQVKIIETFGAVPAELQPLLDDYRRRIEEAKKDTETLAEPVKDLGTNWEKVGETVVTVGQGILDLVSSMGLLNRETEQVLEGIISIGKNLPKALEGDPAAIFGVVAGGIKVVSGIAQGGRDDNRLRTNQALYNAAMEGDTGALDRLLQLSGHGDQGEGWATKEARGDAWTLYQQARSNQDKREARAQEDETAARAPEVAARAAEEAAEAAERQKQEALDRRRDEEEQQVADRTAAERSQHIQGLIGGGGPADLTNKLVELEREFERIVATSPLGADSPLARDARRRADDAARDLERAIDDAKREQEQAQGKQTEAGFTVQRTITESSAGRIVGELTTSNVWLEKIYQQLGGREGISSPGGPTMVHTQVMIGEKVLLDLVNEGQARAFQQNTAMQGNAGIPQ